MKRIILTLAILCTIAGLVAAFKNESNAVAFYWTLGAALFFYMGITGRIGIGR